MYCLFQFREKSPHGHRPGEIANSSHAEIRIQVLKRIQVMCDLFVRMDGLHGRNNILDSCTGNDHLQADLFDFFNLYLDGTKIGYRSGAKDWLLQEVPLSPGSHAVVWEYQKNATLAAGADGAYLDAVAFTAASQSA